MANEAALKKFDDFSKKEKNLGNVIQCAIDIATDVNAVVVASRNELNLSVLASDDDIAKEALKKISELVSKLNDNVAGMVGVALTEGMKGSASEEGDEECRQDSRDSVKEAADIFDEYRKQAQIITGRLSNLHMVLNRAFEEATISLWSAGPVEPENFVMHMIEHNTLKNATGPTRMN
jgi:hypothetical protein